MLILLSVLSVFLFRNYFFKGQVPFPSNLLVAYHSPWADYEWEGYPNGPPNKPIGFDNLKLFYPFRKFTTEQLAQGHIPLWNPYVFSGNIHLATYQSAVLYPLNVLYFVLPQIDAWSLLIIAQSIIAGIFTYLFLKKLSLSFKSSLFGAVLFAYSGWMTVWSQESLVIEHTALWLPMILYSIERLFSKYSYANWLLLVLGLSLSILAGFLQMSIYSFTIAGLWILYRWKNKDRRQLKQLYPFIFGLLVAILLVGIHLVPAIEAFFGSPRGQVDAKFLFDDYLAKPWHLLTFLIPDFWGNPGAYNYFGKGFYHESVIYFGIPGFMLALYALFSESVSLKINKMAFFKWVGITALLLGFSPVGWLLYYSRLPILSVIMPSRIFIIAVFSLSVLSAYGMEKFLSEKWNKKVWLGIIMVFASIFAISWGVIGLAKMANISDYVYKWYFPYLKAINDPFGNFATVSYRNTILSSLLFGVTVIGIFMGGIKKYSISKLSYYVLIVISLVSSFYFANKYLYFSERKFVFPQVPVLTKLQEIAGLNRVWGYGNGYIEKNMLMYYGLYSPEGYDALFPQEYGELLFSQEVQGSITKQILRTDANIRQASEHEAVLGNPYRTKLLSLLGVKYILEAKEGEGKDWNTTEERFPAESFKLEWEDDKYRIYQNLDSLPRSFLVNDYVVLKDKQEIADTLFSETFDLSKTVIVEEELSFDRSQNCAVGTSKITSYTPNRVEIETDSRCPAILFLSDNYYPGWNAYIDEEKTKIYRSDYSFRAVTVPEGIHKVQFKYEPLSFKLGILLTSLGFISLLVIIRR
ncbi:YfhO family protein [Candidatus Microgenomates bacterium]|nr:YfhO family protein [Candidatus Microgenomates bacterium]